MIEQDADRVGGSGLGGGDGRRQTADVCDQLGIGQAARSVVDRQTIAIPVRDGEKAIDDRPVERGGGEGKGVKG
ncbi:hypothetical protein CCR96_11350 [Halochromatium roseum]|nr:hypothetical protein [Halochromatium roseum]MBK5939826.1 hypothetical protein [Halochromatium roseum]